MSRQDRKLDLAARAAWLYYVASNTQDEIAHKLNVSRQAVQRLVSLAVSEKLIKFRLEHQIAECMALGEQLRERFGLAYCSVQPSDSATEHPSVGIAIAAAEHLATYLAEKAPLVIAFSTGRMLRAVADELPVMSCPQHKLTSLVGTISRDGQASSYEVVRRFAEKTGAQCFPIPTPVIASSVEERKLLQSQRSFAVVRELAGQAVAAFVGDRQYRLAGADASRPLPHRPGDRRAGRARVRSARSPAGPTTVPGGFVDSAINERNAALPLHELKQARIIGVSGSPDRVEAIRAALRGGLLGGLITDERTAVAVLGPRNEA